MVELPLFFNPINEDIVLFDADKFSKTAFGNIFKIHREDSFPELEGADIAIIGVNEDRNALENKGCGLAPDYIRHKLYSLFAVKENTKIVDLGNLKNGHKITDTYIALSQIMAHLLEFNIVPIIIGGSQDLTFSMYKTYEQVKRVVNIASIDSRFDIGSEDAPMNAQAYLSKIILEQPNFLFNYTNIGYQTYFVDQESIELMNNLYFDAYRLGNVRADMQELEPVMRNADLLTIDVGSIRQSDFPANFYASPNGFTGDEICKITRYAGISDKVSSIGFFEYNPMLDQNKQSAHLIAQMIWYFVEGFYNRKQDYPNLSKDHYIKYFVSIQEGLYDIKFYKSKKTNRWWMEVPYPPDKKSRYERHNIVPCSYKDYETACSDDIPERWWQAMKKMV
ncbi:MAG: formimidoylglutamase [Bacteroidales bacterium]|nr:formimidoylglutamase [Bacteroidales bacterium]